MSVVHIVPAYTQADDREMNERLKISAVNRIIYIHL